jgi:assimilatory nitrate reductase catalytic subunit
VALYTGNTLGDDARTDTHCPYCALQCGMQLVERAGEFTVEGRDFPTNRGALCRKGWTAAELINSPERLLEPLMRSDRNAPLRAATWPEAIARISSTIQSVQRSHGRHAVGLFGGGGLTNETAYALGKFARVVLRTRSIDYNGRFCMASAAVAGQKAFGLDRGLPFPIARLAEADVIMLVGANPAETMPPLMQYFEAQKKAGGKLIVIDPRRTLTAEAADLHLQITPGTDAVLGNALLHVAIRDDLVDYNFISERTSGFAEAKHSVGAFWPDRAERITGVSARDIVRAAHLLGEAKRVYIVTARGTEQQVQGVKNVLSYINLALALGKVGRPGCGFGTLTGQGNGQGGREHGQKSDQLPGYRKLDDPAHRKHVAALWGIRESDLPGPGPAAVELLDSIGEADGLRALLVMGSNLLVSAPDVSRLTERLGKLDLLVVSDLFLSETAALADVVLPVTQWAEHEGTTTNLEGRVLFRAAAKAAPATVRTDLEVLKLLAVALECGDAIPATPAATFDELCRISGGGKADYAGLSHARVRADASLFWPVPSAEHPGTPEPFLDEFATPDGLARFHALQLLSSGEEPSEEYPIYLVTGRVLAQYQSGTQTRRVASLRLAEPEAFVEMHADLASSLHIAEGDWVELRSRRGRMQARARLSRKIRSDTVFVPFHFGGSGCANNLTTSEVDPTSKIPAFKTAAVAIERLTVQAGADLGRSERQESTTASHSLNHRSPS